MKLFTVIFLTLISFNLLAEQTEALAKGRDHFIDESLTIIKNYCSDFLSSRTGDSSYICRLQIQTDCAQGEDAKKKTACETMAKIEALEKQAMNFDKTLGQLEKQPMYSSKPVVMEAPVVKKAYSTVVVNHQASLESSKNAEAIGDLEKLTALKKKILAQKVRVDCLVDADCQIQNYGKKICGGPLGTFVYSIRDGENQKLISEVNELNDLDQAFVKKWMGNVAGTCDYSGRSDPAKCSQNRCL